MVNNLEANLDLLAMVPLAIWEFFLQRCQEAPAYLPLALSLQLIPEGPSLNLVRQLEDQQEQLGIVFMERMGTQSIQEINEAIRIGTLDPKALEAPPFMTGDDTVLVYGDWFKHLDELQQIDWRMIGRAIQQVLGDHAKVLSSPPNEADWQKMKTLHARFFEDRMD